MHKPFHITKTCPCNILQFFTAVKKIIFRRKIVMFFLFLIKTLIVGTCLNRLIEASTHNLCFRAKIRKQMYTRFTIIKVGCKGVYITRICYPDDIESKKSFKMLFVLWVWPYFNFVCLRKSVNILWVSSNVPYQDVRPTFYH